MEEEEDERFSLALLPAIILHLSTGVLLFRRINKNTFFIVTTDSQ